MACGCSDGFHLVVGIVQGGCCRIHDHICPQCFQAIHKTAWVKRDQHQIGFVASYRLNVGLESAQVGGRRLGRIVGERIHRHHLVARPHGKQHFGGRCRKRNDPLWARVNRHFPRLVGDSDGEVGFSIGAGVGRVRAAAGSQKPDSQKRKEHEFDRCERSRGFFHYFLLSSVKGPYDKRKSAVTQPLHEGFGYVSTGLDRAYLRLAQALRLDKWSITVAGQRRHLTDFGTCRLSA